MKKFLLLIAPVLMFVGCKDNEPHLVKEGKPIVISSVDSQTYENSDVKAEIEIVGREGLRLLEYNSDSKELLQQSVWKKQGESWASDMSLKFVDGDKVVATYPSGEKVDGHSREFEAGVNNMLFAVDVNREKSNKVDIKFKHLMCQVEYNVKDQDGNKIGMGEGNNEISKITMTQPLGVNYDIFNGEVEQLGKDGELALKPEANNFVIPGGANYEIRAVYKNKRGETGLFTYRPEKEFLKNKKYIVGLTIDTGNDGVLSDVSVTVEDWDVESHEGDFVKNEDDNDKLEFNWIKIKAGSFIMGNKDGYGLTPHKVTFTKDFKISRNLITFDQYDAYCDAVGIKKPDDKGWGRGQRPVINVSWPEAVKFCEWAGVRLPTEAEWEYCYRAGTTTKYFWGDEVDGDYYWYYSNSDGKTHPVGQKKPNPWGIYDLPGNVREWCHDWYGSYSKDDQVDPKGPDEGKYKVTRGGSYKDGNFSDYANAYARGMCRETVGSYDQGFRVVKDI